LIIVMTFTTCGTAANSGAPSGPHATVIRADGMTFDQRGQSAGRQHGVAEPVGGDEENIQYEASPAANIKFVIVRL
jgi:hypothetical protein